METRGTVLVVEVEAAKVLFIDYFKNAYMLQEGNVTGAKSRR